MGFDDFSLPVRVDDCTGVHRHCNSKAVSKSIEEFAEFLNPAV
jgi:hypothetical protein